MKLEEIKEGQYLFYTERPYGNYADSLVHIRLVDGVLMAHPVCTNFKGSYIDEQGDNWGTDLPVSSYFDESSWYLTGYKPEYGKPSQWMSVNYPLDLMNPFKESKE